MSHFIGLKRVFVILASVAVPLCAASDGANWDSNYSQGVAAVQAHHYAEALPALQAAFDQARNFGAGDVRFGKAAYSLALTHQLQGHPDQAEPLYAEAKSSFETLGSTGRPLLGYVLESLGELHFDQGRWKDAESCLRQAAEVCRETHGEAHSCTLTAKRHLGELLAAQGSTGEAEALLQHLVGDLRKNPPSQADLFTSTLGALATLYISQNRLESAEPLLRESLDFSSERGVAGPVLADALLGLGELYRLQHDNARAEPLLKKALTLYEIANDGHLAGALNELGLLAVDEGKFAVAREYLSRSLSTYQELIGAGHVFQARVKAGLAEAFLGDHNVDQARALIQEALASERQALGEQHAEYARLLMVAGKIEVGGRRKKEAQAYYRQALEVYRHILPDGQPERISAERTYARFAKSFGK